MADDIGYECYEAYGGTSYQTPVLNKIAASGMRFDHAYANPICTPSRAALLTGQDNWTNGCWFFGMPIKDTSRHFAQLLSEAGYET